MFSLVSTLVWGQNDREFEKNPLVPFDVGRGVKVPDPLRTSPDGKLTVESPEWARFQLVDTTTNKPVGDVLEHRPLTRPRSREHRWAFSPDGKLVAIAISADTRGGNDTAAHIRVWDIATGKLVAEATPFRYNHLGYVRALAFSSDSRRVLVRCDPISGK